MMIMMQARSVAAPDMPRDLAMLREEKTALGHVPVALFSQMASRHSVGYLFWIWMDPSELLPFFANETEMVAGMAEIGPRRYAYNNALYCLRNPDDILSCLPNGLSYYRQLEEQYHRAAGSQCHEEQTMSELIKVDTLAVPDELPLNFMEGDDQRETPLKTETTETTEATETPLKTETTETSMTMTTETSMTITKENNNKSPLSPTDSEDEDRNEETPEIEENQIEEDVNYYQPALAPLGLIGEGERVAGIARDLFFAGFTRIPVYPFKELEDGVQRCSTILYLGTPGRVRPDLTRMLDVGKAVSRATGERRLILDLSLENSEWKREIIRHCKGHVEVVLATLLQSGSKRHLLCLGSITTIQSYRHYLRVIGDKVIASDWNSYRRMLSTVLLIRDSMSKALQETKNLVGDRLAEVIRGT